MAVQAQNLRFRPGDRSGDLRAQRIEASRAANDGNRAEIASKDGVADENTDVPLSRTPLWARSAEAERGAVNTPSSQVKRTGEIPDAIKSDEARDDEFPDRRLADQTGPRMSGAESSTRKRMQTSADRLRERAGREGSLWTLGDAQAGQVDRLLQRTDQASRTTALAQELERLRKDRIGMQEERGAGGAWNRFRNARQQAQTEKALKKVKSNQAIGLMGLNLLYSMALMTWLHTLYPIALMYFAGAFSKFIRRVVPPVGTLLDPKARTMVLRGLPSEPGIGPKIAETLALMIGIVCVFALDILLVAVVVGALEAIDTVCGTPVIGWTCDIVAEISKFFGV